MNNQLHPEKQSLLPLNTRLVGPRASADSMENRDLLLHIEL
jgi:hypothetical protein